MSNFELEPEESLSWNERFTEVEDLQGHKILAVFDSPPNKNGEYAADLVMVTETGCWIVFHAESDSCGEEATVEVLRDHSYYSKDKTLHDFVCARDLLRAGVINSGEHDVLAKTEADLKAAKNEKRAAQLRAQLASIEGGAA